MVQNAIFHGKRHDNKILKVNILLSKYFVVMAQAPTSYAFPKPFLTRMVELQTHPNLHSPV